MYVTKKVSPTKVLITTAIEASGDRPAWNRPGKFFNSSVVDQSSKVRKSWDNTENDSDS